MSTESVVKCANGDLLGDPPNNMLNNQRVGYYQNAMNLKMESEVLSVFCVKQNVTNIHCSCLHMDKRSGLVLPGDISHVRFREITQHCL